MGWLEEVSHVDSVVQSVVQEEEGGVGKVKHLTTNAKKWTNPVTPLSTPVQYSAD